MTEGGVRDDEIQVWVDELAASLDLPTQLTDVHMRSLAFSAHTGRIDWIRRQTLLARTTPAEVRGYLEQFGVSTATGPIRIPADPERDVMSRVVVPTRYADRTLGFLWFLDDEETMTGDRVLRAANAAERIARSLHRRDSAELEQQSLVLAQGGSDPLARKEAATQLLETGVFPRRSGLAAVVVSAPAGAPVLAGVPGGLPPHTLLASTPDHAVLLVPVAAADEAATTAVRMAERVVGLVAAVPANTAAGDNTVDPANTAGQIVTAGVGDTQSDLSGAATSLRQARLAVRAAQRIPGIGPVARWRTLGALRALLTIPEDLLSDAIDPRVLPILKEPSLIETLEAFLCGAGDIKQASASLSVHRGTVYYRLRKVEALTGLSPHRGADRLTLQVGLHLARLQHQR